MPIYGEKNYNNNSKPKGVFNEIQVLGLYFSERGDLEFDDDKNSIR